MMEKFLEKYYRWVFGALALFLIWPAFLERGYIFALDWSIKPFLSFHDLHWSDPLGWWLCDVLALIFSFELFQRIFLGGIFFLAGLAGFRLARGTENIFARYFAGIFLIFNPFLYARTVEQTMLIGGGTVAFFWFGIFFWESLQETGWKKTILAGILGGLAVSFFAHSIFFVALFSSVFILGRYCKEKSGKIFWQKNVFFWFIIVALNCNWLVAFQWEEKTWIGNVSNLTLEDAKAFRTRAIGGDTVYLTVLGLQGYWGEYQERFVSVQDNPFWRSGWILIMFLVVWGAIGNWKKDWRTRPLVLVSAMAFVLAIGIASPITEKLSIWLYKYLPFYIGLREAQKWTVVLVFSYAFFGSWGAKYFLESRFFKKGRKFLGIATIFLPVIFSGAMVGGMWQFSVPRDFPEEWQEAKNFLQTEKTTGKILFLPWHSYLRFDFAGGKNILNPAKGYFGEQVISGNNLEFGGIYSNFSDTQTQTIEKYVRFQKDFPQFAKDMEKLGIDKVILSKTEDWEGYAWLNQAKGLEKVREDEKLVIYQITLDK